MQYVQSLPIFSVGALVAFFVYLVIKKSPIKGGAWMFPAALALAFTLFLSLSGFSRRSVRILAQPLPVILGRTSMDGPVARVGC